MAEDRKDAPASTPPPEKSATAAIPNRDRRRDAPVIDAKPGDVKDVTPAATAASGAAQPASARTPETVRPELSQPGPEPVHSRANPPEEKTPATAKPAAGNTAASAPKPPAHPEIAKTRAATGMGALLLASAAGAVLALGAGFILFSSQYYSARQIDGLLASGIAKSVAGLTGNAETAQRKLDDQLNRQSATLNDMPARVAALESMAKKLAAEPGVRTAPASTDLAPLRSGLSELEKRIAALEKSATQPTGAASPAPGASIPPAISSEITRLAERMKALESRVQQPPPDLTPLQARLQDLQQRIEPLSEKIAPMETAIAANRDAIAGQVKAMAAGRERADATALSVITRTLAGAVSSGAPFADMLKAAQALGAEPAAAKTLESFAAKGLPSAAILTAQFARLAPAIAAYGDRSNPNASLSEKLTASASRLVRIVPADDTKDETPAALASRIVAAMREADFATALALFEKLPEPARAPARAFAAGLREKIEADRAVTVILNAALARLSRP